MKKHISKLAILALCGAAILVAPALSRAQDTTSPAPGAKASAPAKKRSGLVPFHGKLETVDTNAMTFTVGKRTFQVTSETKILKDGQPAVLADGVTGETVSGSYKKAEDGALNAVTVHFGAKADGQKKKKAASEN